MNDLFVELRRVRKEYAETLAVDAIDLTIGRGEFVVLLGPSGSGKTTLLSIVGGFTAPTSGQVLIDGCDVTEMAPAKRPTSTVFQDYALFPHMNVAANIGFGLEMHGVERAARRRRVEEVLSLVGLEGFGRRSVHQLSGGQKQRVALARAIAVEPLVLLLDEPLGALDLNLRRQMQEELVGLQKQLGTTFIHVTHDQDEGMSIADSIVVLNNGRVEDHGPPDRVYLRPATLFAATFMGESNIVEARVMEADEGAVRLETQLGEIVVQGENPGGPQVHLSIRPEHVRFEADEGTVSLGRATLREMTFQGAHRRCRATSTLHDKFDLVMHMPVDREIQMGETIEVFARRQHIVLLTD